ncbi:(d)CMP kinase [bacterium]|nr:(d)CMP kinase [bacterium]
MIVTIDGPAGTGKSTVARQLAERLGFEFLNTGAMYRAVALVCLERNIAPQDDPAVAAVPHSVRMIFRNNRLWLNDRDVSESIRDTTVTEVASIVASNPEVRKQLVALQQQCAEQSNLVTEGRDQGTVVFPHAACKIFLTATAEERARRRMRELSDQGQAVDWEALLADLQLRDHRDATRACAPLVPAADAQIVDSSQMTIDEVLNHLEQLARERLQLKATTVRP